jgi:hypothetical protein
MSKPPKKKTLRPLGSILLDIEPYLLEAMVGHDLQHSDMYGILQKYLDLHLPDKKEVFVADNTSPVLYYGHSSGLNKKGMKKILK